MPEAPEFQNGHAFAPSPSQQNYLSPEPILKVPEISEALTEHEHTSDLCVDFITQLAPVWTSASMENSWNPSYSPPAAVFWDLKKKNDMPSFLDSLFPPRLFHVQLSSVLSGSFDSAIVQVVNHWNQACTHARQQN